MATSDGHKYQPVHSDELCHGLPALNDEAQGVHAIVVGASGMSGQPMVDLLGRANQRWSKVYALSRRAPQVDQAATTVEHVPVDLLKEPSEIADKLKEHGVRADVVFYFGFVNISVQDRKYSVLSTDSPQKLADINCTLLQNFLTAMDLASVSPKRILLQTGLKNYQCHLGPAKVPFDEADPRIESGQANFYYTMEDILFEHCRTHPETSYNISMPSWIVGTVDASDMTTIHPLAIYAVVQRKLGQPLVFPGDTAGWEKIMPMSSAVLNSHFHEWVTLEKGTANERFNMVDDSEFTWMSAWPVIAGWFGMAWTPPDEDESKYYTFEMPERPRGYGPKGRCSASFSLNEWATRPEVLNAWKAVNEEYQLDAGPLSECDGMFAALQFSLTMSWSWATKMDKARKFGWHGHIDTMESVRQVMDTLAKRRRVPPIV